MTGEQAEKKNSTGSGCILEAHDKGRIAFIDTVFPTVGVFIAAEIDYLRKQGVEVLILPLRRSSVPFNQREYSDLMPCVITGNSLKSLRLWSCAILLVLSRPLRLLQATVEALRDLTADPIYFLKSAAMLPKCILLSALCEREGIYHLHGNWAHYPATAARFVSRMLNLSYSFSAHAGADIYRHPAGLAEKIQDAAFVNTCTKANLGYFESLVGRPLQDLVKVIYHGIDIERFKPGNGQRSTPTLILSVGTLTETKGFQYAIEACSILKRKNVNFQYKIVGRGKEQAALKNQIKRLELDDMVVLMDEIPHDELRELYLSATVFLAPSIVTPEGGRDGIPNVLVEAMATGLPVVASEVAGIPELVNHEENGMLVTPRDPETLAHQIELLLNDCALRERLGVAAREKVVNEFDRSANAAVLYQLFSEKVLNGSSEN